MNGLPLMCNAEINSSFTAASVAAKGQQRTNMELTTHLEALDHKYSNNSRMFIYHYTPTARHFIFSLSSAKFRTAKLTIICKPEAALRELSLHIHSSFSQISYLFLHIHSIKCNFMIAFPKDLFLCYFYS